MISPCDFNPASITPNADTGQFKKNISHWIQPAAEVVPGTAKKKAVGEAIFIVIKLYVRSYVIKSLWFFVYSLYLHMAT